MDMTRREFLAGGVLALGSLMAADRSTPEGATPPARRLAIGIISDLHIDKNAAVLQKLERALDFFRNEKVDGVLIPGDIADNGLAMQLEELAIAWEKIFPDSKGSDGRAVEELFLYGDHDNRGRWMDGELERIKKSYNLSGRELADNAIFTHPEEHWRRIFKEPYSPIVHKRVRGYDFVLAHFNPQARNQTPGLREFLSHLSLDPSKPFFYAQHRVLRNTACGPGAWGQDDGSAGEVLSAYPNAVAFCGHGHQTAVREDSIWQGAFTAIEVPSLKYVTHEADHANNPNGALAEQGLVMSVYDGFIKIDRLDFTSATPLAQPWIVPLSPGKFNRETRRQNAIAPQFPPAAKLDAAIKSQTICLSFPVAGGLNGGVRAYDYEATVYAIRFGGNVQSETRRFFSPKCDHAASAEPEKMTIDFPLDAFKPDCLPASKHDGALHIEVRPREIFGGTGRPITSDIPFLS